MVEQTSPSAALNDNITIIEPSHGWISLQLRDVWRYRELLYFLAWRSVKIRYKQTIIGVGWAIIQPFSTMVVFSLLFGGLARIPSDGIPYPIFSFAALVPWTFFATALSSSTSSVVGNAGLIKKVYFPRLIVPLAAVFSSLIDFLLAFSVLMLMMVYYMIALPLAASSLSALPLHAVHPQASLTMFAGLHPAASAIGFSVNILWLPLFALLALITALGVGLWLSALNTRFRDIQHIVPFIIQLWMFLTPIVYPASLISDKWRLVYSLNPMAGVVEGFRWALLNKPESAPSPTILVSVLVSIVVLVSGAYYFRRMERTFADVS